MATINLYFDNRQLNEKGLGNIKIKITQKTQRVFIATQYSVLPEQWKDGKVVGHPQKAVINRELLSLLNVYTDAFYGLRGSSTMAASEIKKRLCEMVNPKEEKSITLLSCFDEYIKRFTEESTISIYTSTIHRLQQKGDISIDKVSPQWLMEFDNFMKTYAPKKNSRNIHLRNIRAVCNYAIDCGYTTNYPFRRFKITPEATAHRVLEVSELRKIITTDYGELVNYHRDMLILSFTLVGMNYIDMAGLKEIVRGRVNYNRSKTGKLYSIKVEPEALEIINRHRGKGTLIDMTDHYSSVNIAVLCADRQLKHIYPFLTTYYARHTWATIASELGIPKDTIADALGHSMGNSTTAIYIRPSQSKIDEANRKVLDYVFGGIGSKGDQKQ